MPAHRRVHGFTYLTALFMIAIMGAGLALLGEIWETAAAREKEAELLYVGNQYRLAIQRYYLSGLQQYPRTFQDLLKDPRSPSPRRHLRQLYPDPITGSSEWAIIKGPDGGIMGVHSRSEAGPLKITNFKLRDRDFEGAAKYSDWKFVYVPVAARPVPTAPIPGSGVQPAAPMPGAGLQPGTPVPAGATPPSSGPVAPPAAKP
jgi:type II secretory pathway pseudopilin PulG